jgi:hypothetical protein
MSRTIEAIMAHMQPVKRVATPGQAKRFTASWQTGLESGGRVQRKLRLAFTNVGAHQPA